MVEYEKGVQQYSCRRKSKVNEDWHEEPDGHALSADADQAVRSSEVVLHSCVADRMNFELDVVDHAREREFDAASARHTLCEIKVDRRTTVVCGFDATDYFM